MLNFYPVAGDLVVVYRVSGWLRRCLSPRGAAALDPAGRTELLMGGSDVVELQQQRDRHIASPTTMKLHTYLIHNRPLRGSSRSLRALGDHGHEPMRPLSLSK